MDTLDQALEKIVLSISGNKLEEPVFVLAEHLPDEVLSEFNLLTSILGTDKLFRLYNSRDGIALDTPRFGLDIATGKAALITFGGVIPVKNQKLFSISKDGSTFDFESPSEKDENGEEKETTYYSIRIRVAFVEGHEGGASTANLVNSPEKILTATGVTGIDATGKIGGAVRYTFKADTKDEYSVGVFRVGSYQIATYNLTKDAIAKIDSAKGANAIYKDGVLSIPDVGTFSTKGAVNLADMNPGEYKILSHRSENQSYEGRSWTQCIVSTPAGDIKVKAAMGRLIASNFNGDNMTLVVPPAETKMPPYCRLDNSSSIAEKFKGKFKLEKAA